MKRNLNFFLAVCSGIFLSWAYMACSSVPDMQLESAATAMKEMENLDAAQYAVKEAKEAQSSWEQSQKLLDSKNYKDARTYLLKTKGQADMAIRLAKSARELKRKETESWKATIDVRAQALKTKYQEKSSAFKPEQKKEMDEFLAKIDQANVDLKKELEAQHYYKTAELSHKIMGTVNEGEALMREVTGAPGPKSKP